MSYKYWLTQKITNKIAFFEKKKNFFIPMSFSFQYLGGEGVVVGWFMILQLIVSL